jgi:hypothetical protein
MVEHNGKLYSPEGKAQSEAYTAERAAKAAGVAK